MQVKNVGDERVIGCVMLHIKPCAPIWGSAENSEVSLTQFQKRIGTDVYQVQGLLILANVGQPKLAVSTIVILEVFDGHVGRV